MNSNIIWKKVRRVLALALVVALCGNATPQTLLEVRAAGMDISVEDDFSVTLKGGTETDDGKLQYTLEGDSVEPEIEVKKLEDDSTLQKDTDYTVVYTNNTTVGTASVTVTGTDSYSGSKTIDFQIVEEAVTESKVALTDKNVKIEFEGAYEKTENVFAYTGNTIKPTVKVTYLGADLSDDSVDDDIELSSENDYDLAYSTESEGSTFVGAATVTITAKEDSGYTGTVEAKYYVRYDLAQATVKSTTNSFVYNDGDQVIPELQVIVNGVSLNKYDETTLTGDYRVSVGKSDVVNSGVTNITLEAIGEKVIGETYFSYTISPKPLKGEDIQVDAVTYTGTNIDLTTLVVRDTTVQEADGSYKQIPGANYSLAIENTPVNAGNYELKIEAGANSNYMFKKTDDVDSKYAEVELTVKQLDLSSNSDLSLEYKEGTNPAVWSGETVDISSLVTAKYNGQTLNKSDYKVTSTPSTVTGVGSYQITITAEEGGNLTGSYTFDENNNFKINYDTGIKIEDALSITGVVVDEGAYYYKDLSNIEIEPKEGYTIDSVGEGGSLENGKVTLGNDISVENGISTVDIYVIKTVTSDKGEEKTGNKLTLTFTLDETPPSVSVTPTYTNPYPDETSPTWVQAISLYIKCSDIQSGVNSIQYYYEDNEGNKSEPKSLKPNKDGSDLVIDELESDVTYYFGATDNVGNETTTKDYVSIKIPKIDDTNPTITIKDGENVIYSGSGGEEEKPVSAVNINTIREYSVDFTDGGAGYDESKNSPNKNIPDVDKIDKNEAGYFTIENTVTDYVGNTAKHTLHVYYDPIPPEVIAEFGENEINEESNTSIVTNQNVTISGKVNEQIINDEYQLTEVQLVKVTTGEVLQKKLISEEDEQKAINNNGVINYEFTFEVKDGEYLEKTDYKIVAYDKAENSKESAVFSVEIDKVAPSINTIDISGNYNDDKNGIRWYNSDTTFTVSVNNNHPSSATVSLFYCAIEGETKPSVPTASSDDGAIWTKIEYAGDTEDISYDAKKGVYTFKIPEYDNQFSGTYYFWVQDTVGNAPKDITGIPFKKDKIPANTIVNEDGTLSDAVIYVEYASDDELDDVKEELTKPDKYSFFQNVLNRLFAKEYINVRLYIYDNLSRVDKIVYECGDSEKDADAAVNTSAIIDNQYYSYVELTLTKAEAEHLKVNEITDCAGNVYAGSVETKKVPEGNTVLIIDNVRPVLTDNYDTADGEKDGKKFYRPSKEGETSEVVELTYKEAFFEENVDDDEKVIYPSIIIKKNGSVWMDESNSNYENYVKWGEYNNDAEVKSITAQVILPYSDEGAEVEYQILSQYEDGSGNRMEGASLQHGSVTEENGYESGIIVLDNKAPELTSYTISGKTDRYYTSEKKKIAVYKHQKEQDVVLTFSIDDSSSYWNAKNVRFKIYQTSVSTGATKEYVNINGEDSALTWEMADKDNTPIHTATYNMAVHDEEPALYYVQISYQDVAGNQWINAGVTDGTFADGIYTSKAFILDESEPLFDISYNAAYRLIKEEDKNAANDKLGATPETGYVAYYDDDIQLTFTIEEDYANELLEDGELNGLVDFTLTNVISGQPELPDIIWSKNGNQYTGTLTIKEEGCYSIKITYRDLAANNMTTGATVQGSQTSAKVQNGEYQSIKLVLDKTAPAVTTWYSIGANKSACEPNLISDNERQFFNQPVYLNIKVEDTNIRTDELKSVLRSLQLSGKSVAELTEENSAVTFIQNVEEGSLYEGEYILSIPLSTEENYTIPVAFEDLAGNRTAYSDSCAHKRGEEHSAACYPMQETVTVDTTLPTFTLEYEIIENEGIFSNIINAINYKNLGYLFANGKLDIKVTAEDATAGIHDILIQVKNRDGEVIKESVKDVSAEKWSEKQEYNIVIPLEAAADFQGSVDVIVTDWSANTSNTDRGYIVESEEMHKRTSGAAINTLTAPSRIFEGEEYYNTDVNLEIMLQDNYSGILNYQYVAGNLSGSQSFAEEAGGLGSDFTQEASKEIQNQVELKNLVLDNNADGVRVWAQLTDNAGYTTSIERTYNIDKTKPVITVNYDLNSPANELYYNAARTATVTIQERNFSVGDVEFIITNTEEAMPVISGWTTSGSGDDEIHTCTVIFAEDGDYTFTVKFKDKAGNVADYNRVDTFTIDRTEPTYTVTYDNNESLNGSYFAAGRTATIDILEHNFDASLVNIEVTATNGEGGVPSVSGWSRNGDHNVATIQFSGDADYTFDISGVDMAENAMADYEEDSFVVDTTAPEITIFDIENMSANNGAVMPGIRYSDTNYDAESSVIEMVGYHNGKVEMVGDITRTAEGVEIKLHDFEHTQSMDDLYTMNATVYDLAGNSSEASVVFSVNRFGSVYTFDEATEELIGANGKYYTNEEQDIVITETNVDTLEFKEITCNLNGELTTLKEGEDYTVKESGSDMSWKQYTYTLAKNNFVEEGTYLLTIYSEDRATNTSDNSSKGKKVEFVVDKTSPSVLISGIADNEQYRVNSKEVTLDVQDNVRLSEVKVAVNGVDTVYNASQVEELDGKIIFTIGSANNWQTLRVTAYDAAGNVMTSDELHFLITTNIFIQFIRNKQLLFGSIAVIAVIGAGSFYFVGYKRRKREEAE